LCLDNHEWGLKKNQGVDNPNNYFEDNYEYLNKFIYEGSIFFKSDMKNLGK